MNVTEKTCFKRLYSSVVLGLGNLGPVESTVPMHPQPPAHSFCTSFSIFEQFFRLPMHPDRSHYNYFSIFVGVVGAWNIKRISSNQVVWPSLSHTIFTCVSSVSIHVSTYVSISTSC